MRSSRPREHAKWVRSSYNASQGVKAKLRPPRTVVSAEMPGMVGQWLIAYAVVVFMLLLLVYIRLLLRERGRAVTHAYELPPGKPLSTPRAKEERPPVGTTDIDHPAVENGTRPTRVCVAGIYIEARLSREVKPTSKYSCPGEIDGKTVTLAIDGNKLVIRGRSPWQVAREYFGSLQTLGVFGITIGKRASSKKKNREGSMIANLVIQGDYGHKAGLWLLSHVLYGDVCVSTVSKNSLFASLGTEGEGLRVNTLLDADIVMSLRAVTDNTHVYLCLNKENIFKLRHHGSLLLPTRANADNITPWIDCTIVPLEDAVYGYVG